MLRKIKFAVVTCSVLSCHLALGQVSIDETEEIKQKIFHLAESYEGQGDPDQSKQRSLDILVQKLIKQNPMPPVKDRISVLAGAWKQVWGPYDYRNDEGGIDPKIGVKEIYQVVFADGYYYNVAPYYPDGDQSREQISLLRGEFRLDSTDANGLRVKFTKYPGVESRPVDVNLWDLPLLAESGSLENRITIVPTWIVRLFFGGGKLEEVYTDHDMRLLYGSKRNSESRKFLYVMKRVQ